MSISPHKVKPIVDAWYAAGQPYCDHPSERTTNIQDLGSQTEEGVCLICGASWDLGDEAPPPRGNKPQ